MTNTKKITSQECDVISIQKKERDYIVLTAIHKMETLALFAKTLAVSSLVPLAHA